MSDPFSRHRSEVPGAVASGDPAELRALYGRFGSYLEEAAAGGAEVPVLSYPETAALVVKEVPASAALVLDAGCGPNPAAAELLAGRATTVVGLDVAAGTVRLARAALPALLGVVGDVEHLPFRDGAFDALVCDDTIEHVPHDDRAAGELGRVLVRGGTAVVATPNRVAGQVLWRKGRDTVRRRRGPAAAYYAAESHLREYTPRGLRRLLAPSLTDVRVRRGRLRRVIVVTGRAGAT